MDYEKEELLALAKELEVSINDQSIYGPNSVFLALKSKCFEYLEGKYEPIKWKTFYLSLGSLTICAGLIMLHKKGNHMDLNTLLVNGNAGMKLQTIPRTIKRWSTMMETGVVQWHVNPGFTWSVDGETKLFPWKRLQRASTN